MDAAGTATNNVNSSRTIIITAPCRWDEMFRGQTEEKLNQLGRRITKTQHFPFRYVAPDPPLQEVEEEQEQQVQEQWNAQSGLDLLINAIDYEEMVAELG